MAREAAHLRRPQPAKPPPDIPRSVLPRIYTSYTIVPQMARSAIVCDRPVQLPLSLGCCVGFVWLSENPINDGAVVLGVLARRKAGQS